MPFNWVVNLMKSILFGSRDNKRGISSGILIAYWIVFFGLYLYYAIKNESKKIEDMKRRLKDVDFNRSLRVPVLVDALVETDNNTETNKEYYNP